MDFFLQLRDPQPIQYKSVSSPYRLYIHYRDAMWCHNSSNLWEEQPAAVSSHLIVNAHELWRQCERLTCKHEDEIISHITCLLFLCYSFYNVLLMLYVKHHNTPARCCVSITHLWLAALWHYANTAHISINISTDLAKWLPTVLCANPILILSRNLVQASQWDHKRPRWG